MKRYIKVIEVIILLTFSILKISDISREVNNSIVRCINIIIPSLFITMAISDYIVATGCFDSISHIFFPLAKVLGMDERLVPVFIISNIGGYPIGIRMLSTYVKKREISSKQAGIIASYCFGAGPAFTVGTVGSCVYNSTRIGAAIFLSVLISNFIGAIIINRVFGIKKIKLSAKTCSKSIENGIISSVESASRALFSMCSVIVAFSFVSVCVKEILTAINVQYNSITGVILRSVTDVTNIVDLKNNSAILPVVTLIISLGGFCVWLQCLKLSNKAVDMKLFFLLKLPVSLLSSTVFYMLFSKICSEFISVSSSSPRIIVNIDNFVPSICLIIMIFIFFLKKRLAFDKKV